MNLARIIIGMAIVTMLATGCGQDDVTLPDQVGASGGACGAWYPGGDVEIDGGTIYNFVEGEIIPCFVWESVRVGPQGADPNAYINMGELHLQYKHGKIDEIQDKYSDGIADPRAIVLSVSALNCAACQSYISSIATWRDTLEDDGAILIGVARSDVSEAEWLDMEEADELILDEGWPEDLHRTNDAERHLGTLGNIYPMTAIIDLETMTLLKLDTGQVFFNGESIHDFLAAEYN